MLDSDLYRLYFEITLYDFTFFQSSDMTPESSAFTLMFLYVGIQLFGETQQAQEILEVYTFCMRWTKSRAWIGYIKV